MEIAVIALPSFIVGVAATVLFNIFWPFKIDKASRELNEELIRLRAELARKT